MTYFRRKRRTNALWLLGVSGGLFAYHGAANLLSDWVALAVGVGLYGAAILFFVDSIWLMFAERNQQKQDEVKSES